VIIARATIADAAGKHILFSPWLLVAVAIVAWIKLRPRGSRQ
jgi:hypothetical protein